MGSKNTYGSCEAFSLRCFRIALWKCIVLVLTLGSLIMGAVGCALDDFVTPVAGDIPFEQEQSESHDIGAVDNTPTVPDDDAPLDQVDFRPF